jgi:hypothetical protein
MSSCFRRVCSSGRRSRMSQIVSPIGCHYLWSGSALSKDSRHPRRTNFMTFRRKPLARAANAFVETKSRDHSFLFARARQSMYGSEISKHDLIAD